MNLLQSLLSDVRRPDTPPHAGESFFLWTYDLAIREARALILVMCNHTTDGELQGLLQTCVSDVAEPQIKRLEELMREEGIVLPSATPDPPKANATEIPPGARLCDSQIARMLVVKVEGLLDLSYNGMRFSQRTDVAALFMAFLTQVATQGYSVRETMLKRGWFPLPPMSGGGGRTAR